MGNFAVLSPDEDHAGLVIALGACDGLSAFVQPALQDIGPDLHVASARDAYGSHDSPEAIGARSAGRKGVPANRSASGNTFLAPVHTASETSRCLLGLTDPDAIHSNISSSPARASSEGHTGMALGRTVRRRTASMLRRWLGRRVLNSGSLSHVQVPAYMKNVSGHSGVSSSGFVGRTAAT